MNKHLTSGRSRGISTLGVLAAESPVTHYEGINISSAQEAQIGGT